MKVINVYDQYYSGQCVYNDVERRAAQVMLIATSEEGTIRYEAAVSFFPHQDEEDFAVSGDAYAAKELFFARGRRSKKREAALLEAFRAEADALAASLEGSIDWEHPLRDARYG
jgi:hypothetical protein